jgi:peptidoglycan/xylan/chitin deacetylase (PgdA/CDA1 family)
MILLYHAVFPESEIPVFWSAGPAMTTAVFKRQILWLAKYYRLVSLEEYLGGVAKADFLRRPQIAVTFDDGLEITFRSVSGFLVENQIPATIFVTTSHLEQGELLWFSYLNAVCFEGLYQNLEFEGSAFTLRSLAECGRAWQRLGALASRSGDASQFCRELAQLYPIPEQVARKYQGMTYDQLLEATTSKVLQLGAHTVTHPFLTQLAKSEQQKEISEGKQILERLSGQRVHYFAYPAGDYNTDTLQAVHQAGFDAAFAVTPRGLSSQPRWEIGRVGIYSHSLLKLSMKAMGLATLARRAGLRVG